MNRNFDYLRCRVLYSSGPRSIFTKTKIDVSAVDTSKIQPASEQNGNIAEHTAAKRVASSANRIRRLPVSLPANKPTQRKEN